MSGFRLRISPFGIASPVIRFDFQPRRRAPRVRRAPITYYRKLLLAVFFADIAEAVLNANGIGTGTDNIQYIHHVDMTARERPINPRRLQDVQLVGSVDVKPTIPVVEPFSVGCTRYHHRRQRALTEGVP